LGGKVLSVVIPAYNEATRLPRALPALFDAVDQDHTEVIVVDDGSTDRTADVARDALAAIPHGRLLRYPMNAGKGAAVRFGVSRARGHVIAFADADMAADPRDLRRLVAALDTADVAVGSRAVPGAVVAGGSRARAVAGRAFNRYARAATGLAIADSQCGFKAFRGPVAKVLFHLSQVNGFAFDVELLLLAARLGFRISEVPVHWTAVPESHVQPVRDGARMAADVLRSRRRWHDGRVVGAVRVLCREPGIEAAAAAVAGVDGLLRMADPVAAWRGGALVFMPCTGRMTLRRVAARVGRRLAGDGEATVAEFPVSALLHPSTGLLDAAVGAA
jgi:dolichyl-phosphate beta-glucosyltransferase